MRFLRLELNGFKKYLDHQFQFDPGLNLVVGPNEAGKTSLHQALVTALYGVGKGKSSQLLAQKGDARHWKNQVDCRLSLDFELGETKYRIAREIDTGSVRLSQQDTDMDWEILTEDKSRVEQYLSQWFALPSAALFNQTISVQQNQVAALDSLPAVGDAVESLLTGAEKVSLQAVERQLNDWRKQLCKQRNEKPGRIDTLETERENLATRLARANAGIEHCEQQRSELNALEKSLPESEQRLKELKGLQERFAQRKKCQDDLDSKQKERQKLLDELARVDAQREKLVQASETIARYKAWQQHEVDIPVLAQLISEDRTLRSQLEQEQERAAAEREKMHILVQNKNIFLRPNTLYIVATIALVSLIIAIWLWELLALLPGVLTLGWFVWRLVSMMISRRQLMEEQKTDLERELERKLADKQSEVKAKAHQFELADDVVGEIQAFEQARTTYYDAKAAWKKAEDGLAMLLEQTDEIKCKAQSRTLAEGMVLVSQQLELFEGFAPDTEEVERWRNEAAQLAKTIPENRERISRLAGELAARSENQEDVTALSGEMAFVDSEIENLREKLTIIEMATQALQEAVDKHHAAHLPLMEERSSHYLARMTAGRYAQLDLAENWPEIRLQSEEGGLVSPEKLSTGTVDQVYLALRLGVADLLSHQAKLPLILDDPFVNFDEERLNHTLAILAELAAERQIIFFTTRAHFGETIQDFSKDSKQINVIKLAL